MYYLHKKWKYSCFYLYLGMTSHSEVISGVLSSGDLKFLFLQFVELVFGMKSTFYFTLTNSFVGRT